MEASFTFTQPARVTATVPFVPNIPVTIPSQTQKMPGYCATCTPLGKQCPTNYPMTPNPNWSNSEGKEGDWNSDKQKQKELKKLQFKNNNITDIQSPKSQSTFTTDTNETVIAPQFTNTLVPSKKEKQKDDNSQNNFGDDSKTDFDFNSTIDNIV